MFSVTGLAGRWLRLCVISMVAVLMGCAGQSVKELADNAEPAAGLLTHQPQGFSWRSCDGHTRPLQDTSGKLLEIWRKQGYTDNWPVFFRGYYQAGSLSETAQLIRLDQLGGSLEKCDQNFTGYQYRVRSGERVYDLFRDKLVVRMPQQKRRLIIPVNSRRPGEWQGQLSAGPLSYQAYLQLREAGCYDATGWYRLKAELRLNEELLPGCVQEGHLLPELTRLSGQRQEQTLELMFAAQGDQFRASIGQQGRQRLALGHWRQLSPERRLLQLTELAGQLVSRVWVLIQEPDGYRLSAPDTPLDGLLLHMPD